MIIAHFFNFQQGDYDNAIRYGEMIKISNAKSSDGYVNYGASLMAKGILDAAIECFKKALEFTPTHFEAIYNLGEYFSLQFLKWLTDHKHALQNNAKIK